MCINQTLIGFSFSPDICVARVTILFGIVIHMPIKIAQFVLSKSQYILLFCQPHRIKKPLLKVEVICVVYYIIYKESQYYRTQTQIH